MNKELNIADSTALTNNSRSLRALSAICVIAGTWALIFEIYFFHDWSIDVYFARVLFTFIALCVFLVSFRKVNPHILNYLIHLLILSLIGSFAFTIYKIPDSLYVNSQILSLLVFTTAIMFNWEVKNQILVAIYYNLLFAGSIFLVGKEILHLSNLFSLVIFVSLISLLSIAASAINYKIRSIYKQKTEEINFIFNSVPLGICRTSIQGDILTANNFMLKLFNITGNEANLKLYDLLKNKPLHNYFNTPPQERTNIFPMELEYRNGKEPVKYFNIFSHIIPDERYNKSLGFIIQDNTSSITLQREKEKTNSRLFDEITKKEKMTQLALREKNQKIQLLAKINHDVRTPLNSIMMFHDMVKDNILLSMDEVKKYSKSVKTSVGHLLNTINNFIDYAKIETGKMEMDIELFSIKDAVEDVIELMIPLAIGKKLNLTLSVDSNSGVMAYSDVKKYSQILINLIANSIKFTPAGDITVFVNNVISSDNNHKIITTIEDTGIGIQPDQLKTIFDPFVSLQEYKTDFYGSGLGLAICKEYTQMLGGDITVDSTYGKGTKFTLTIPYTYNFIR